MHCRLQRREMNWHAEHSGRFTLMIIPPPHLDVYYASTCAPCRVELPVIYQALRGGSDIRILVVSDMPRAKEDLSAVGQRLAQVASFAPGPSPNGRLRLAGDADGILPYTQAVDGRGHACASWRGMLTLSRIRKLFSKCR